ncbi:hypothetical protein [Actinomadura parmotrematis]|uniref:Integral membrane protein n=1 Tax=Actinomadura parmotrematis TaxID=2864039 RepID=A0ABS7FYW7_9ACTN|nr:hypothetical protein [Actinomadura parmotrematis]MBW8485627.1 hypothetical protein [Actinomadura parmotrematis]
MTNVLATAIIVVALLAAAFSGITALRDRPMGWGDIAGAGAVEALLAVQLAVGSVKLAHGEGPAHPATFVGYLVAILLIPPAGVLWGLLERSRWGPTVIVVAGLAVAVMIVRMNQLWSGSA